MISRRKICFVVNELYPLHKGGIGRWIFNLLNENKGKSDIAVLLYGPNFHDVPEQKRNTLYDAMAGLADVYFLDDLLRKSRFSQEIHKSDSFDEYAYESMLLYSGLKCLSEELGLRFDYIEFIDFGGPAFYTSQASKSESWLDHTLVSVRLHSTNSIIAHHEVFDVNYTSWHSKLHDIERKALWDADIVVTHIECIAKANQDFYSFPDEWLEKIVLEVPHVILDDKIPSASSRYQQRESKIRFAFTSRLAPFKQPNLFISAAIHMLGDNAEAEFVLASYGWDEEYINKLKRMIPEIYKDKILFLSDMPETHRLEIINESIIVIPSIYESYCFLAYETLLHGRRLILNSRCLAFGDNNFWQHGVNCLLFDGSSDGLAQQMSAAIDWRPTNLNLPAPTPGYWEMRRTKSVLPPKNHEHLTVFTFADAGSQRVLSPGLSRPEISLRTLTGPWAGHKRFLEGLGGEGLVAFVLPGMSVSGEFVDWATNALEKNPEYAGVVPQYRKVSGRLSYGLRGGDLVSCAVSDLAKIGVFGAIFRRSLFENNYWELEGEHWLHAGISRAILSGSRLLASPWHGITITAGAPDQFLSDRVAAGLKKTNLGFYQEKFKALIGDTHYHYYVDEISLYADLRRENQFASELARERLGAIYEMETLIVDRDNHIAADAVLLKERMSAIEELSARIDQLEKERNSRQPSGLRRLFGGGRPGTH